jgi:nicotinate-nucleotide pyrophosphorylase
MTALHPTDFPGTQAAAIKAVLSGGASPHRLSLSETLLVFAEHRTLTRPRDVALTLESG